METMENDDDVEEVIETDDQYFTLTSVNTTIDPFMNAILGSKTESFECDTCGLHFPTPNAYNVHKSEVCFRKVSKNEGFKAKKSVITASGFEGLAEVKSEASSLLSSSDLHQPSTSSSTSSFKYEPVVFDSNSQPALGAATGDQGHWKCNQCLVAFTTGPDLFAHQEELRVAKHKCSSCHIIFDERKLVLAHKKKFHSVPVPSTSTLFTKIKTEDEGLEDVKAAVFPNDRGEYVCNKCDRAFKDKELMIKHLTCHNEDKPFECLECGKKFGKAALLRDHKRRHFEKGAFECSYCQKRFFSPNKLREHIRVHTGETPLSCNVCGKGFKRHSNLSEHKRIHEENRPVKPPKEFFCHCGKMFKNQRDLDWHIEGDHERVPKKCNYCGDVFVHSTSLTRHVRLRHEANFVPADKKSNLYAKCPLCAVMFYKTSINKHIRIKHHGQKPFSCDICKMSFVTKNNMEDHQWQHKGMRSRPFKCQLCRKAYLRQSLLEAHMRSHRGVKPFVCNECGLQFSNKSNWQRHVAEHSGVRSFQCTECDKRFSRNYYLTDHLKTHTGIKPYSCSICGKTAATRSNYNSHLRTHITREPVNSEV
jgi:uncharacterized Zn-finger protein